MSERHDDPGFWRGRSKEARDLQGGICAACPAPATDGIHIEPLGMRASRHDSTHPLNALSNILGMCRRCHEHFDRQSKPWRRARGAELKAKLETLPGHGASRTGGIR